MGAFPLGKWKKVLNILNYVEPEVSTGTADIDISESDYTAMVTLLTIVPPATGLSDLSISLDYAKATTGIDVVATASDTLDVAVYGMADGTNARMLKSGTQVTLAGDGSVERNGERFDIGAVDTGESIIVKVKLSTERADAEVPYRITYKGLSAPTVTAVAAG